MTAELDDDSALRLARRFRSEAIAALVSLIRDPKSTSTAKAAAADKLLSYSDGRPVAAKPMTASDIDIEQLTDADRAALFEVLISYFAKHGWAPQLQYLEDPEWDEPATPPLTSPPVLTPPPRRRRVRLDDDDIPPRRRRPLPRLDDIDDDAEDELPAAAPTPIPVSRPRLRPVPGPDQVLIYSDNPLVVRQGRVHEFRAGFALAPRSLAAHPIVSRLIVRDEVPDAAA